MPLQNAPLYVPDQWSATWFRQFVVEMLAKADVRNAIGQGVTITYDGNSVATISADAETQGAVSGHNADPLAHTAMMEAHKSEANPHPQYGVAQLPVGSIFLTAEDISPETLLGYGTWVKRGYGQIVSGG